MQFKFYDHLRFHIVQQQFSEHLFLAILKTKTYFAISRSSNELTSNYKWLLKLSLRES